jgi:hypothetical protein
MCELRWGNHARLERQFPLVLTLADSSPDHTILHESRTSLARRGKKMLPLANREEEGSL